MCIGGALKGVSVQVVGTVPTQFFKAFLLMRCKLLPPGHMAGKTAQEVAEMVGVFDGLAGHRGLE